jgi:hypothetical protein
VQGRGSAANSAVCYALGVTAVDPVGGKLLFERFLTQARRGWRDIDLDLPSGDRRERVTQEVFRRYGKHGAAMNERHHLPWSFGRAGNWEGSRIQRGCSQAVLRSIRLWGGQPELHRRLQVWRTALEPAPPEFPFQPPQEESAERRTASFSRCEGGRRPLELFFSHGDTITPPVMKGGASKSRHVISSVAAKRVTALRARDWQEVARA